MIIKKLTITVLLCAFCIISKAQHLISEGTITYKITISGKIPSADNQPALTESKSGTVTIKIKSDNVRQDIALEDGYQHAQISNFATGKEIILQSVNDMQYAIEINIAEKKKSNANYANATLKSGNETKKIAGLLTKAVVITYKDKTTLPMFLSTDYYLAYPEIFERFPEIKGIPASYDLLLDNGFTTHFELSSIDEKPVDNTTFRIPVGYRIIKQKEYEKLLK